MTMRRTRRQERITTVGPYEVVAHYERDGLACVIVQRGEKERVVLMPGEMRDLMGALSNILAADSESGHG